MLKKIQKIEVEEVVYEKMPSFYVVMLGKEFCLVSPSH